MSAIPAQLDPFPWHWVRGAVWTGSCEELCTDTSLVFRFDTVCLLWHPGAYQVLSTDLPPDRCHHETSLFTKRHFANSRSKSVAAGAGYAIGFTERYAIANLCITSPGHSQAFFSTPSLKEISPPYTNQISS